MHMWYMLSILGWYVFVARAWWRSPCGGPPAPLFSPLAVQEGAHITCKCVALTSVSACQVGGRAPADPHLFQSEEVLACEDPLSSHSHLLLFSLPRLPLLHLFGNLR